MKKVLIVVVAVMACTGCAKRELSPDAALKPGTPLEVTIDGPTGCEYLKSAYTDKVLIPRIAADGRTHKGCKGAVK